MNFTGFFCSKLHSLARNHCYVKDKTGLNFVHLQLDLKYFQITKTKHMPRAVETDQSFHIDFSSIPNQVVRGSITTCVYVKFDCLRPLSACAWFYSQLEHTSLIKITRRCDIIFANIFPGYWNNLPLSGECVSNYLLIKRKHAWKKLNKFNIFPAIIYLLF